MSGRHNIVLVGFMGTGKTTVGRLVADRMKMAFVDMDTLIEEREGKSISRIFAENGEPHFRLLEQGLVRELSARSDTVIAAGGGVILKAENIAEFSRSGVVVCLTASSDAILKRVSEDSTRPLLEKGDKSTRILLLMQARRELYASIPLSVDTTSLTPAQVADEILDLAS